LSPEVLDTLKYGWHGDWTVLTGILLAQIAYLLGIGPLRRRYGWGPPVSRWRIAAFQSALLVTYIATQSPLHDWSDNYLFSAHMVQHLLLMQAAPPLLLAGTPGWLLRPLLRVPGVRLLAAVLTAPLLTFFLADAIFAVWHIPVFYDAAMFDHNVHILMHLMLIGSSILMWWPIYSPLEEFPPLPKPLQMLYLFLQSIPTSIIGALIALSEQPAYQWYTQAPRIFGISVMDDQKLGGLIMWVPGSMVFWFFMTIVFFQWFAGGEEAEEDFAEEDGADAEGAAQVTA
jgi:putative membrane protein